MPTFSTVERATIRVAFEALGELFRYPDEAFGERLAEALSVFTLQAAGSREMEAFAEEIVVLDRAAQQAAYTATFDLAPSCPPYLGVHLFGPDGPERARLMIGLRESYRKGGVDADAIELPDHVAEVLSFAGRYADDEWGELGHLVLRPALAKMNAILAKTANPYRHLVAAALRLAEEAFPEGGAA